MSVLLSDCSGGAPLAETPGGMNLSASLFHRAENSNKPNQKASAAKRDQCMNPSLSTQSAFTTKLNVRKGPALLCTAVDHACHSRSSSLVVRINSISNHVLHEAAQEFAGTSRPAALSSPKVLLAASPPGRPQTQNLPAPA